MQGNNELGRSGYSCGAYVLGKGVRAALISPNLEPAATLCGVLIFQLMCVHQRNRVVRKSCLLQSSAFMHGVTSQPDGSSNVEQG